MNKSRNFVCELYPEDDVHCDILDYIISYFSYAYILHDKDRFDFDIFDNDTKEIIHKCGDLKKPHWHVLFSFKNPRTVKSVQLELTPIELQNQNKFLHVETCNFYAYSRYLIHKDSPLKFQYSESDIITNIDLRIKNALSRSFNSSECDSRILLDYIFERSKDSFVTFRQLTDYALQNDCLNELKRNTYFYKQFCDDFGYKHY